jgi:hypothetical protein
MRLVLALVAVGSIALHATEARAFCRLTTTMPAAGTNCTTEGVPLYWPVGRQCLSYSVVPRAAQDPPLEAVRDVVTRSFDAWEDVDCNGTPIPLDLEQTLDTAACVEPQYNYAERNANSVIFVTDWAARGLDPKAFGVTLVWHEPNTGEIFDADIQINERLGNLTICDQTCPSRSTDIQNVVTHEAGHFLGLGHSDVDQATMAADAPLGETGKRSLHEDDREGLCSVYGHYPAPACVDDDFQPDNDFGPDCYSNEINSCGCSVPGARPSDACACSSGDGASAAGCSLLRAGASRFAEVAFLALLAFAWLRTSTRRRVRTSSSTPKPTNK